MFDPNDNLVNIMNESENVRDRPVASATTVAVNLLAMSAKSAILGTAYRLAPVQVYRGSRKLYKVIKK